MTHQQTGSLTKSFIISFYMVILIWVVKWAELKFDLSFAHYGIQPRKIEGLIGILASPFIHEDIPHLLSNTFPLFVTASMLLYFFEDLATKVLLGIYLLTGICVWVFGRPAIHIGASGVLYGLTSFLFFSGLFRRDTRLLGVSFLVLFLYGGLVWGIFPIVPQLSWESHLSGGLAGVLFAYLFRKQGPQRKLYSIETDDEEESEDEYWKIDEPKTNTKDEETEAQDEEDKSST